MTTSPLRPVVASLLALAVGAACGAPPKRPSLQATIPAAPTAPDAAPTAPDAAPPATTPPQAQAPAPAPVPPPPSAAGLAVRRLQNGMTGAVRTTPGRRTALLQVGVDAGAAMLAPGAAELALHALAEANVGDGMSAEELARIRRDLGMPDVGGGRVALRRRIADLGGVMTLHTGPLTCWLDIRVDVDSWPAATAAVARALAEPTLARAEFERVRQGLVAARTRELDADPAGGMARLLLLGEDGIDSYLRGLVDRDASEAAMFAVRGFQPDRMHVVAESPQATRDQFRLLDGDEGAVLGRWVRAAAGPALPLIVRQFASGLWWAPAADAGAAGLPCQAALVLPLPSLAEPTAADDLVALGCLTLDGVGGRLARIAADRGVGDVAWRAEVVATADGAALVLRTETPSARIGDLWRTVNAARASLQTVPPTESERELARARAPLTARLGQLDDGARVRQQYALARLGAQPEALDRRLAELAAADPATIRAAVDRFLARPFAMIVVGGVIPADVPDVRVFRRGPQSADLPAQAPAAASAPAPAPAETGAARTQPWLERAAEAVGGKSTLQRLRGWRGKATASSDLAPTVVDAQEWRADGTLVRKRTVLDQTVTTQIAGDGGVESLGDRARPLDLVRVRAEQRELRRHPLALLSAHARGEITFRTVAMREADDRQVAVLESTDGGFERLRLHVDAQSHLIRVVESWETNPDGNVVHLHESWQDYRSAGPLRAPFHALVTQDDGRRRVAVTWTEWLPTLQPE